MSNFNFEPQGYHLCTKYDGFIDKEGNYYIVKESKEKKDIIFSNAWAHHFMKEKNLMNFQVNQSFSMILELKKLKNFIEILVHGFGYIYYSHDSIYGRPYILLPNPNIALNSATSSQIDVLYNIMQLNNEHPEKKEFIIDSNMYIYDGDEERKDKIR